MSNNKFNFLSSELPLSICRVDEIDYGRLVMFTGDKHDEILDIALRLTANNVITFVDEFKDVPEYLNLEKWIFGRDMTKDFDQLMDNLNNSDSRRAYVISNLERFFEGPDRAKEIRRGLRRLRNVAEDRNLMIIVGVLHEPMTSPNQTPAVKACRTATQEPDVIVTITRNVVYLRLRMVKYRYHTVPTRVTDIRSYSPAYLFVEKVNRVSIAIEALRILNAVKTHDTTIIDRKTHTLVSGFDENEIISDYATVSKKLKERLTINGGDSSLESMLDQLDDQYDETVVN